MEYTKIKFTGGTSNVKKIREISQNKRIYKHNDELKVFQGAGIITFQKNENVVIWENNKITKERDGVCVEK